MTPSSAPARTVLVLGANGRFGLAAAQAFAGAGWRVVAQVRRDAAAGMPVGAELVRAPLAGARRRMLRGRPRRTSSCTAINPVYTRWDEEALPAARAAMDLAERFGARFMLPGNVYNHGASMPERIDETTPQRPTTAKGRIRVEMEAELERRAAAGRLRATVITAGDFFGAGSGSWFDQVVVKSIAEGHDRLSRRPGAGPRLGLPAGPGARVRRRRLARRPRAVRALRLRRALGDGQRIHRRRRTRCGDARAGAGARLAPQRHAVAADPDRRHRRAALARAGADVLPLARAACARWQPARQALPRIDADAARRSRSPTAWPRSAWAPRRRARPSPLRAEPQRPWGHGARRMLAAMRPRALFSGARPGAAPRWPKRNGDDPCRHRTRVRPKPTADGDRRPCRGLSRGGASRRGAALHQALPGDRTRRLPALDRARVAHPRAPGRPGARRCQGARVRPRRRDRRGAAADPRCRRDASTNGRRSCRCAGTARRCATSSTTAPTGGRWRASAWSRSTRCTRSASSTSTSRPTTSAFPGRRPAPAAPAAGQPLRAALQGARADRRRVLARPEVELPEPLPLRASPTTSTSRRACCTRSRKAGAATSRRRGQLDWRCDFFSLAAMLWRYLPELDDAPGSGWTASAMPRRRSSSSSCSTCTTRRRRSTGRIAT